ncbi:hypothetical protein COBT_002598, partial [Conglomerata obtusa]
TVERIPRESFSTRLLNVFSCKSSCDRNRPDATHEQNFIEKRNVIKNEEVINLITKQPVPKSRNASNKTNITTTITSNSGNLTTPEDPCEIPLKAQSTTAPNVSSITQPSSTIHNYPKKKDINGLEHTHGHMNC